MLWKGILYFLIKNPEYRYLIGPVSISGNYSSTSKELIIKFIKKNFYNSNLAKYIVPRTKYEVDLSKESDIDDIVETSEKEGLQPGGRLFPELRAVRDAARVARPVPARPRELQTRAGRVRLPHVRQAGQEAERPRPLPGQGRLVRGNGREIGRASCRERV